MEKYELNTPRDPTIISRFYLSTDEIYSPKRYRTVLMRMSLFEKILTKYLFQSTSKDFSLYEFLEKIKKDQKEVIKLKTRLNFIIDKFNEEGPLSFYSEFSKEILGLINLNLSSIKFDHFILKTEFFLACHFENNFYEKQIDKKLNTDFYGSMNLQRIRTNFNYSIESLNTIFKFLKVFERQSISTKIENDFMTNHDLFCTEKIYYFFCDRINKEKIPCGNIVEYLLKQLTTKFDNLKNSKVNNIQLGQYILMNLFLISKIVMHYSFYFTKKPELESIFYSILPLKTWPIPVGNFVNEILDILISECSFQGINVLNKIREKYFIDFLNYKIGKIETKYFRSTLMLYSDIWDKRHCNTINSEKPSGFNLLKFLERIKNKKRGKRKDVLNLREFVMRVFITFIMNSKQTYTDDVFIKLYNTFYTDYNKYNREKECDEEEEGEAFTPEDANGKTKESLNMLLKIIDVGFDKANDDFEKEIDIIAEKLIKMEDTSTSGTIEDEEYTNNVVSNNFFLPITFMRNYLKPHYTEIKKLYRNPNEVKNFDLFDLYIKNFKHIVTTYFPHLIMSVEDPMLSENLKILREKFYMNYRLNIALIEEEGVISDFIENINQGYEKEMNAISDEEFNKFWKFFASSKKEIEVKYLLHVLPHYENYKDIPFKISSDEDDSTIDSRNLSEYIASNDIIYKNIVFMPWASKCDETFYSFIPICKNTDENVMIFPSLDTVYSFLKKPLDFYLTDSMGVMKLSLYQITINDNVNQSKIFWKNMDITLNETSKSKITLECVDFLGLECKEGKNLEMNITTPFKLKMFNLFFKKDVPFNYNMTSNNGWLEVFLMDKYSEQEEEKICSYNNFIKNNIFGKYYEEFNVPQMDIETVFKNFKVKRLVLETNKDNLIIKCNDKEVLNIKGNIKQLDNKDMNVIKITVSEYKKEEKNISLPIATFISL